MKQRWVGTSWKMTKTLAQARAFVDELVADPLPEGVRTFVLPAHTSLATVRDRLPPGCPVLLGAQNASAEPEGARTGEVSMRMVRDAGAQLVELGHSERRELYGETDETVAAKVRAALDAGLTPLVCVGEPWGQRCAGQAEIFVQQQLTAALASVSADERRLLMVAYEPVWAIGEGGRAAEPEQIQPVLSQVADIVGDAAPVLYGGSVTPALAADLRELTHLDGLFVGRAAWSAAGLRRLLGVWAEPPPAGVGALSRPAHHSVPS